MQGNALILLTRQIADRAVAPWELPARCTARERDRWARGCWNGALRAIRRVLLKHNIAAPFAIAIFLGLAAAQAAAPFDWDRYNARQDACRQHDELLRRCAASGAGDTDWCNTALRQTARDCSAFGPLGNRPRGWR